MRTADVCPTCATYYNALCVIFDGPFLSTLNIPANTDLDTALVQIEAWASTIEGAGTSINVPYIVKTTLTPAQVISIGTTPITTISMPSLPGSVSDYAIVITDIQYYAVYQTTPYDANALVVRYSGGTVIDQSLDLSFSSLTNSYVGLTSYSFIPGQSVQITGTDSISVGDTPVQVHLTYRIIDIT